MKKIRFLPVLLVMTFVTISCGLFAPKVSSSETAGEPINVIVTLDENDTNSATITPEGGTLTSNATDGFCIPLKFQPVRWRLKPPFP